MDFVLNRIIGGYFFNSLNHFDLCFVVENLEDQICGFVFTINESEKYDKLIQSTWITQLQQKYPNVDQVKNKNISSDYSTQFLIQRMFLNILNVINGFMINILFEFNYLLILISEMNNRILLETN